jgi:plastocyanin
MTPTRGPGLAAAAALALLLAGSPLAGTTRRSVTVTVNVTAKDYSLSLSAKSADLTKVTFSVKNSGKHDHNFQIAGKKTSAVKPGKTAKLTVTFAKPGSYSYSSTVDGDAGKGMKGTFTSKAIGDVAAGKQVFVSTGCGACHRLKAAGTTGTLGPNLDKSKASLSTIEKVVTSGKGTMQPYRPILSAKQIDDVSQFVYESRTG